tara:strand:+ start:124 stop:336 length:213 start_codon:yes stop_codon:yes gene_type:complete
MKDIQPVITSCLQQQYKRLEELLTFVPEGIDLDANPTALAAAEAIWAIEEEWIINKDIRDSITMLTTYEN